MVVLTRHGTFPRKVFNCHLTATCWILYPFSGFVLQFLKTLTFNIKHKIYEFSLYLKVLYFVSKGSLIIPEYRNCKKSSKGYIPVNYTYFILLVNINVNVNSLCKVYIPVNYIYFILIKCKRKCKVNILCLNVISM